MSTNLFITFSKPFINAARVVFETMVFTKIEPGKPSVKKDELSRGDVTSVMGITGTFNADGSNKEIRGMFILSWPYETYIKMANAMLMESFTEYSEEISDVGGEITNMIMGNAKRELREIGYCIDMSIPSMIGGANHSITYPSGVTKILIPIISAHGPFFMEICYTC